ncbi:MAG: AAA family ATPase, partial [Deltaproteobacteria bacterium]|nr:AAA family ATPase [Deltaproteobacteria bacterium]
MDDSPKETVDSRAVKNGATERVLPVGATDFAIIRQNGVYYADKTEFLYQIVKLPFPFFLSRPRRFGKTLLVDTLECILQGRRYLFKGLWIDQSDYDWRPYPVIRLEMNGVVGDDLATMESSLSNMLENVAMVEGLTLEKKRPVDTLTNLVSELHLKSGQEVATLIDMFLAKNEGIELAEAIPADTLLSLVRLLRANGPKVATFLDEFLANSEDLKPGKTIPTETFLSLIELIKREARQKVAILIDEYDAPIVEHLADPPQAELFREALRIFYGALKTNSDMIGHIFITGVSRYSQLSIFSELNQL